MMFREMANLGITLVNESDEIVGYAALYDQPNWISEKSEVWTKWLKQNFAAEKADVSLCVCHFKTKCLII